MTALLAIEKYFDHIRPGRTVVLKEMVKKDD